MAPYRQNNRHHPPAALSVSSSALLLLSIIVLISRNPLRQTRDQTIHYPQWHQLWTCSCNTSTTLLLVRHLIGYVWRGMKPHLCRPDARTLHAVQLGDCVDIDACLVMKRVIQRHQSAECSRFHATVPTSTHSLISYSTTVIDWAWFNVSTNTV